MCACCGTHVSRSGEVGLVKFVSCQKFTKGSRIELLCGKRALDFLSMNFEQNSLIGRSMAASLDKTAAVHEKQKEELIAAKLRLAELEKLHCEAVAKRYAGAGDVLHFEDGLGSDSVRRLSVLIAGYSGGLAAVFSGAGSEYKYALTGPQDMQIKEFIPVLNAALNGKGGGRDNFAQGSVKASKKEIEAFMKLQGIRQHD